MINLIYKLNQYGGNNDIIDIIRNCNNNYSQDLVKEYKRIVLRGSNRI